MKRANADHPQQEATKPSLTSTRRSWLAKSTVPVRQEHVQIAGRSVAVTEDEVGVAELHLE